MRNVERDKDIRYWILDIFVVAPCRSALGATTRRYNGLPLLFLAKRSVSVAKTRNPVLFLLYDIKKDAPAG